MPPVNISFILLWKRLSAKKLMLLNCGVGEDSWESLELQGDPTSPFWRRSALGFLWKEWCWSWNSSTLGTSCKELTHWKRFWCWEGLGQEEKGTTEDEMAGWHDWLDGRESEWTPEVGDGQGGLVCCSSWGGKELATTELLNWTKLRLLLKTFGGSDAGGLWTPLVEVLLRWRFSQLNPN